MKNREQEVALNVVPENDTEPAGSGKKTTGRSKPVSGFSSTASGHSVVVPGSSRTQYAELLRTKHDQRGGGSKIEGKRKPVAASTTSGAGTAFVGQPSTRCGPARLAKDVSDCFRIGLADDRSEREEVLEIGARMRSSVYGRADRSSPHTHGCERRTPFRLTRVLALVSYTRVLPNV